MTPVTGHMIAVVGSSPGVGKSTLCRAIARRAAESGATVDHFEEADILSRPSFRPVAEEFADGTGSVRPATLVESTRDYVARSRAAGVDVLVTDALLPFIPSLVAWGHDESVISTVLADLEEAVRPTRVTVVYLRDDPDTALRRAVEREGPDWEDWYVTKLGDSPGTRSVKDLSSAAEHLRREEELTVRLLAGTDWHVLSVDVGRRDAARTEQYVRENLPDL
ncbi:ATP-binding protein [Streptomyces sp. NPDC050433]|uniref:ATP-binding protein n=1 Tax=Streptomyces sp. NPDC050433 TaxID=3365615 RepID=UPI0037AB2879